MKNKALAVLEPLIGGLHTVAEASEDEGKSLRKDLEMAYARVGKDEN